MIELVKEVEPHLMERLVELEAEAFGTGGLNDWHLVPLIRHGRVYILRNNAQVIGLVEYMLDWNNASTAYMVGVSIAKESRGQGSGATLLQGSFNALFAEQINEVELTVDKKNTAAVKLYEKKFGFAVTAFRFDEYGAGEDRLVMKVQLASIVKPPLL